MNKTTLKKYARLIAVKGVNVRKGQEVVIRAGLDCPDFVAAVVEECYRAGASKVTVEWDYQPLTKVHTKYRSPEVLARVEEWEIGKLKHRVETLPCMIYIESDDPDGLGGIDRAKHAEGIKNRMKITKPISDEMENKYQWCIAAAPGEAWAKKVFPTERKGAAVEHLWQSILTASRADCGDPCGEWDRHNAELAARCEYLNGLGLSSLRIRTGLGTDLTVGLIPEALFLGGSEVALGSGIEFNPNIPSEEVFITPMKGKADGVVYSSMPFSYRGLLIEGFSVTFRDGKAVEIKGSNERETETLLQMINMDGGASFLGEVALVPYSSPIRRTGILFRNTLFDENAACHLALGRGFSNCLRDYEKYSLAEAESMGVNDSMIHEDFMIGTADTEITGICADGTEVTIFRNGEWESLVSRDTRQ